MAAAQGWVQANPPAALEVPLETAEFGVDCAGREGFYYVLYRNRGLDGGWQPVAVEEGRGAGSQRLFDPAPVRGQSFYRLGEIPVTAFRDLDKDGVSDIYELRNPDGRHPLNPAAVLDPEDGAVWLPDRAAFETLSRRDNVPGAMEIREVKFLITGVDTDHPRLHFMHSEHFPYHYYFGVVVLGLDLELLEFNAQTYTIDDSQRKNLAGSLLAHDHTVAPDGSPGLYTIEFWPTDPVAFHRVEQAFDLIAATMPFARGRLAYHPAGETQEAVMAQEAELYAQSLVRTVSTETLFGNVGYAAMHPGASFGRLRIVRSLGKLLSARDIVLLTRLPNDLSHVAGIITEAPQTPLSHVNLKARQNNTPNAYVAKASERPEIAALEGRLVYYEVGADGFVLREATPEEVEEYYEETRPKWPRFPPRDLSVDTAGVLNEMVFEDAKAYGAKAANLAELRKAATAAFRDGNPLFYVPYGYAAPFSWYVAFMEHNGYHDEVRALLQRDDFLGDPEIRNAELARLRAKIRKEGVMPDWVRERIGDVQGRFSSGVNLRCRSSTNNEDLPGFNGAGLYDSYTHRVGEGHLEKSIRQVWASLWNYRAFEEREFHRIDHLSTTMGVVIHPNFDFEKANGVGVTHNIVDSNWLGYYVNAQVGEDLVTNPEADSIPDEFLVSLLVTTSDYSKYAYEVQYVRASNRRIDGRPVLTTEQIHRLADSMQVVQRHFRSLYSGGRDFAMEIEFKIDAEDRLVIKQARPWGD